MPKGYTQLTSLERQEIAHAQQCGFSSHAIGCRLGRAHTTVLREVHRHTPVHGRYRAEVAQAQAQRRRQQARRPRKLATPAVRQAVVAGLAQGWSPEAVAGRLTRIQVATLSRGPIYQLLREEPTLPHRPGAARHAGAARHERIHGRIFLDQRPAAANDRTEAGHWEGDTVRGPQTSSAGLLTLNCRKTRYSVLGVVPDRTSASWCAVAQRRLHKLPCCSLTIDNGMEFASHHDLAAALQAPVYFAHPGCPWERGTNEHHNGLLRWWVPKGTDVSAFTAAQIQALEAGLNNRPRKQFDWQTPAEKMAAEMTARAAPHGGREGSTPPQAQLRPTP